MIPDTIEVWTAEIGLQVVGGNTGTIYTSQAVGGCGGGDGPMVHGSDETNTSLSFAIDNGDWPSLAAAGCYQINTD